ncbi:MAG: HlyD family efflux transporter periplasmic adaptor subunit [Ktedonobacteraceae bacterium]
MRRAILVPLLITIALLAIVGGAGYFIYNNYYYYTTDDAQINGQLVNVSSTVSGQLATLTVKQGDTVTAGQTIGTITPVTPNGTLGTTTINLTSPIAGRIVQTLAVQGQNVSPGLAVAQVTNPNNVNVVAYIDESALNNIKTNQTVDIHVDAFGGTSYTGHIDRIVQAAASQFSLLPTQDSASGNFTKVAQRVPVYITLDNNGGNDLVPGLSAEVTIHQH